MASNKTPRNLSQQSKAANTGTGDVIRSVRFPRPLLKRMKQLALDKEITVQDFILEATERALLQEKY